VGIRWDARTYDRTSATQQAWASDVLARLHGIAADATVLDVGCGTGLVTEGLLALVPLGRVLAIDQSSDMVALARTRLGDRALIWCQDVLELELEEPVDAVISTATLHWVPDHDRLWSRLASALGPGGVLEVQCGGEGNINRVREVIDAVASELAPELTGFRPGYSPARRRPSNGCSRPGSQRSAVGSKSDRRTLRTSAFVPTSILAAHLDRLPEARRERFAAAVVAGVRLPLDHVRLNVSAVRQADATTKRSPET